MMTAGPVAAMQKYHGRAADPTTGAALPGARILVSEAGSEKPVALFNDAEGATRLVNPVLARSDGRYAFYAPNGRYRLRVTDAEDQLVYDLDDVTITDPYEPRVIAAAGGRPALSLYTLGQWADVNLPLIMERQDESGKLIGARWRCEVQFTEKGWNSSYNQRRRGGAAAPSAHLDQEGFTDLSRLDSEREPCMVWGANDADDGIFGLPGLQLFGGGLWAGEAHQSCLNARLAMPEAHGASGVEVRLEGPADLDPGDVVALDPSAVGRVSRVTSQGAKVPFVVSRSERGSVFVIIRGLAWVKVTGVVKAGDILVTSFEPGLSMASHETPDPNRTLGVATVDGTDGWALVKIQRVGQPRP